MSTPSTLSQVEPGQRFPVSVKGVILHAGRVVLLYNERNEWELPGGKLELGETPEACVRREIQEEVGLDVTVAQILDPWVYHIYPGVDVLIVPYGCQSGPFETLTPSHEHKAVGLFPLAEVPTLPMPEGYKRSIRAWAVLTRS